MSMEPQIEPGNNWLDARTTWNVWVLGRIKRGVSRAQAQTEIQSIAAQLVREHPKENDGMQVHFVQPGLLGEAFRGPVAAFTGIFMGVASLVLLIACSNLASFLLARAIDRSVARSLQTLTGLGSRMRLMPQ